jgi:hypothetical protein
VLINGDDPLECPGVDADAIRDDMAAAREAGEDSLREFFSEAAIFRSLGYRV